MEDMKPYAVRNPDAHKDVILGGIYSIVDGARQQIFSGTVCGLTQKTAELTLFINDGHVTVDRDQLFFAYDDAVKALNGLKASKTAEYKAAIKTPADLVAFMFRHLLNEGCNDPEAYTAAVDKAQELLGVTPDGIK